MNKDITLLEDILSEAVNIIKEDKKIVSKIKSNLATHGINHGETQKLLNFFEEEIESIDKRVLILLTKEVFIATGNKELNPRNYFEENVIKVAETFDASIYKEDQKSLPITIPNVLMIDGETYVTKLSIKFIKNIFHLLRYNFETQREAKFIRKSDSVQIVARINKKAVSEITTLALEGNLDSTLITLNALAGTSDEGDELLYDTKKQELTITKGTFVDILDGFHRLMGAMGALEINPDLDFSFMVAFRNFTTLQAQRHFAQINTINPISKNHVEAMKAARLSDTVVKKIRQESDLKGKITTSRISSVNNELVNFKLMSDTIEQEFKMETKRDATKTGEYLTEFFNTLVDAYPEEFIRKIKDVREESLINTNVMIGVGYVVLAKRMYEEDIPLSKLSSILDKINFSKDNKEWDKLGVDGIVSDSTKKAIKSYFLNLKIEL